MKITRSFCIAMVCFFFVSGCATIINGSKNPIAINSNPDGAEISIINKKGEVIHKGTTPATVTLKSGAGYFKGEDYKVIFKKEGYAPKEAQIQRKISGWYIGGNFLFGGLIGWLIVDPITGAMWTLSDLNMDLEPQSSHMIKEGVHIIKLDDVPDALRSNLVKLN